MPSFIKGDGRLFVNKALLPDSQASILEFAADSGAEFPMLLLVRYQFKKVRLLDRSVWWEYIGWKGEKASDEEVINVILRRNNKDVGSIWFLESIQIATVGVDKCSINTPYEEYFAAGLSPDDIIRGLEEEKRHNDS